MASLQRDHRNRCDPYDAMGKAVNPGKGKRAMYEAGEHTIQETADTFDVSQPTLSFSSQSAAAPSSAP